jgi:hypothetical protein
MSGQEEKASPTPSDKRLRLGLFRPEMSDEEIQKILDEMYRED